MKKRKILVWETLATVSGGQKMTLTIIDILKDQYDICMLIPSKGIMSDELDKRNIEYILMGDQSLPTGVKGKKVILRYGLMSIKSIFKSLKIIKKFKPDLLYAPGPAALPWSAVCGALTRKPVIWHLHHVFLDGATRKLLNICSRWNAVKRIIAVSNCVGEQISNSVGKGKIDVQYNPVDVKKYAEGSFDCVKAEIEQHVGQLEDTIVIGHVALVQESKRQDFVIDTIKRLNDEGKKVVGLLPGECRDFEYLDRLKEKIRDYGLENKIWLMGRRNDIPNIMKAIDVLMIPSAFEGFPLAGLEAVAAGVPVSACNVAGAEEFIRVSGAGSIFAENDVAGAVESVEYNIANIDTLQIKGKRFAESCDMCNYSRKIMECFEKE